MTFEEYARQVGNALVNAQNQKSMSALNATFREADQTLGESSATSSATKAFWSKVRETVETSPRLLAEKQANSALIALMQAIEQGLKDREGKVAK